MEFGATNSDVDQARPNLSRRNALKELAKHPRAAMPFRQFKNDRVAFIALETMNGPNLDELSETFTFNQFAD